MSCTVQRVLLVAAIALFRLSFACCFFIIGCYSLVRFYRSRWILDIRTRWEGSRSVRSRSTHFRRQQIILLSTYSFFRLTSSLWSQFGGWERNSSQRRLVSLVCQLSLKSESKRAKGLRSEANPHTVGGVSQLLVRPTTWLGVFDLILG